ncbi:MAG TPA: hypothetical protein PKH94_06010 [Bacteroidales bacterium]|nr:hypothetical protein [Bacteroidales bacterium]HNS46774.1 hypothetical protein [Bacteroidales bacterium]
MKRTCFIGFLAIVCFTLSARSFSDVPPASAGPDATICEGDAYVLAEAFAANYERLQWTTSGTGSFNKPAILNPTYKPSAKDIKAGSVTLMLSVTGQAGHPDTTCSMFLTIIHAPRAFAGGGDVVRAGDSYFLSNATAENHTHVTWSTSGTGFFNDFRDLHPTYTPSAEDARFGSVTLTLTVKGKGSCEPVVSDMILNIN